MCGTRERDPVDDDVVARAAQGRRERAAVNVVLDHAHALRAAGPSAVLPRLSRCTSCPASASMRVIVELMFPVPPMNRIFIAVTISSGRRRGLPSRPIPGPRCPAALACGHENPRRRRVRSRQAAGHRGRRARRAEGGRGAGRDQGHRRLPHRRVHALGRRSRRAVPGDPRARRGRRRARGRARRDQSCRRAITSSRSTRPSAAPASRASVRKTNLCTAIRATQGKGLMPDGTSRFSRGGQKIHHYMGCSTFAQHTVLPEIALAKIRPDAPFDKVCYIGCGVTTGIGAVFWTAKVTPGCERRRVRPGRHRAERRAGRAHRRAPTRSSASTSTRRARRSRARSA